MSRAEIQREKLLNAMIFFTKNTRSCHKLKLFKLLCLLDFEIFQRTGKTTTGLSYFAWPMGPVPKDLFEELKAPHADMTSALLIAPMAELDPDFGGTALVFKPRRAFDDGCFTPRELAAMTHLAEVYFTATGKQMTDVTHARGTLWHQIYEIEKRPQALIPFERALDGKPNSVTKEQAEQIAEEERELAALFK